MLKVTIPAIELYDEVNEEFVYTKAITLQLEHSLVSLSKWEAKWQKPFLSKEAPTIEETRDYIKCMTITQNVDEKIYLYLPNETIDSIREYIGAEMTATKITNDNKTTNREIITAEIIYYWMIALNIPFECKTWHLNQLLTLINVCNIKNSPPKKMGKNEQLSRNARLNAERKKKLNSKG